MKLTYRRCGDYFLPNIDIPEEGQHQRVKIPHDDRMIAQRQMVCGRITFEARQTPSVQRQSILVQHSRSW